MTSTGDIILSALYAVINLMISILIGFILCKMNVLTPITRKVVSDVNYNALVPIYGLIYIMQAIDRDSLSELGMVLFSSVSSVIVGFIITLAIIWIIGPDVRYKFAYTFVVVYQNVVVMPQMLADSLCAKGGKYETTNTCKKSLVKPYCALPFIYVNLVYWITVLPVLQNEKSKSNIIRKVYLVALHYYDSVEHFLSDKEFKDAKTPDFEPKLIATAVANERARKEEKAKLKGEHCPVPSPEKMLPSPEKIVLDSVAKNKLLASPAGADPKEVILQTEANLMPKPFTPVTSKNEKFIEAFYGKFHNQADYDMVVQRYKEFKNTYLKKEGQDVPMMVIKDTVLKTEDLRGKPPMDDLCSLDFYKRRILQSPPAVWSIIGVILGFIFPFKEWFFDASRKPLPTFIATLQTVGGMMSPISLFLLGTYIAQSATVSKELYIRWKHIIFANVVRNLLLPLIGLLWAFVFIKGMNRDMYDNNPVLMFIQYTYWFVPNGVILIGVYVVADYFAKEFAVLSIYLNLVSIPMMAIYMIIYFIIYDA